MRHRLNHPSEAEYEDDGPALEDGQEEMAYFDPNTQINDDAPDPDSLDWERRGFTEPEYSDPPFRKSVTDPLEMADPKGETTLQVKAKNVRKNRDRKFRRYDADLRGSVRKEDRQKLEKDLRRIKKDIRQLKQFWAAGGRLNVDGKKYLRCVRALRFINVSYQHNNPQYIMLVGRFLTKYRPELRKKKMFQRFIPHAGLNQATANLFVRLWETFGEQLKLLDGISQEKLRILSAICKRHPLLRRYVC